MYNVKVIQGENSVMHSCVALVSTTYAASHPYVREGKVSPGIELLLKPSGLKIRLPDDGEVAYVTNDKGRTVDTHRWPLKPDRQNDGHRED